MATAKLVTSNHSSVGVTSVLTEKNPATKHYLTECAGEFQDFTQSVDRKTSLSDYPLASATEQGALVYDASTVNKACQNTKDKQALMAEWINVWLEGPGVLMITGAMADDIIDHANTSFERIINDQHNAGGGAGDHFAKAGENDRIWNALQKHCQADPLNFIRYYANRTIAMASEAWLGTGYQITAQVNRVNPGGAAQSAHRDYHLGFMSSEQIVHYPMHVHMLSPVLTLQGAIAHCDMPLETGPTLYLPYSQHFPEGYLAFNRQEFQEYFNQNRSQLALKKGDAVFFNPALMHAAGENTTTDTYRLANLLQISSAFGRVMESIDFPGIVNLVYPDLLEAKQLQTQSEDELSNVVSACTDGYPFPTSLDTDLPSGGLAPQSQRQYVLDALSNGTDHKTLMKQLYAQQSRRTELL